MAFSQNNILCYLTLRAFFLSGAFIFCVGSKSTASDKALYNKVIKHCGCNCNQVVLFMGFLSQLSWFTLRHCLDNPAFSSLILLAYLPWSNKSFSKVNHHSFSCTCMQMRVYLHWYIVLLICIQAHKHTDGMCQSSANLLQGIRNVYRISFFF